MLEPISAAVAGLVTTKVLENLAGDCLYDVLKFGTTESGAAVGVGGCQRAPPGEGTRYGLRGSAWIAETSAGERKKR